MLCAAMAVAKSLSHHLPVAPLFVPALLRLATPSWNSVLAVHRSPLSKGGRRARFPDSEGMWVNKTWRRTGIKTRFQGWRFSFLVSVFPR